MPIELVRGLPDVLSPLRGRMPGANAAAATAARVAMQSIGPQGAAVDARDGARQIGAEPVRILEDPASDLRPGLPDGTGLVGPDLQYVDGRVLDLTGAPAEAPGEILVVDKAHDAKLRTHLGFARSLRDDRLLTDEQRVHGIAAYADAVMGGQQHKAELWDQVEKRVKGRANGRRVLLGEVPRRLGGGVCRHRSLLFNEMAGAAGLDAVMHQGVYYGVGWHSWNDVHLRDGRTLLVDLTDARDRGQLVQPIGTDERGLYFALRGKQRIYQ